MDVLKLTAVLPSFSHAGALEAGSAAKAVAAAGQESAGGEPSAATQTVPLRKICTKKSAMKGESRCCDSDLEGGHELQRQTESGRAKSPFASAKTGLKELFGTFLISLLFCQCFAVAFSGQGRWRSVISSSKQEKLGP